MKLGTSLFLGASSLLCLRSHRDVGLAECSSSTTTNNNNPTDGGSDSGASSGGTDSGVIVTTDSGSGTDSGGPYVPTLPPASPTGGTPTTLTTPHNFALHHIHMGEETAFPAKTLGYDIDGLDTTALSTNVCTQATDANKKEPG